MPSLSSTYLLPALILNPAFILHLINTLVSHLFPPPPTASVSPHPLFEALGPVPGSTPYLNMHTDDQLCWRYTAIMVFVQLLAFGRVQDNRVARKSAKERARARKEKLALREKCRRAQVADTNAGGLDGMCEMLEEWIPNAHANGNGNANGNGIGHGMNKVRNGVVGESGVSSSNEEDSLTETSEEDGMFI